jgi:hypothetical protein
MGTVVELVQKFLEGAPVDFHRSQGIRPSSEAPIIIPQPNLPRRTRAFQLRIGARGIPTLGPGSGEGLLDCEAATDLDGVIEFEGVLEFEGGTDLLAVAVLVLVEL